MSRSTAVTAGVSYSAQCEECGAEFTARADARFCSDRCRLRSWRRAKDEEARRAEAAAAAEAARRAVEQHHARWTKFLRDNLPSNSRVTDRHIEALYRIMLDRKMIEAPFPQRRLF